MKHIFLPLTAALLLIGGTAIAQEQPSIGLRGGLANGLALKWFLVGDTEAIEGIVTIRQTEGASTLAVTALYELHNYDFATENMRWYYGAGPRVAMGSDNNGSATTSLGVDGIIGIEYRIQEGPISLSADWKPSLALIGTGAVDEGAITLRYQF